MYVYGQADFLKKSDSTSRKSGSLAEGRVKRASRSFLLLLTGGLALGLVLLRVPCWCCGAAEEEPGIVWAKIQEKMVIK